jgi:hypothetical protein
VIRSVGMLLFAWLVMIGPVRAQDSTVAAASGTVGVAGSVPAPPPAESVTFPIGERFTYSARYGPFSVGEATMSVAGLDTIRGVPSVRIEFRIHGGALWYHLDQLLESWVGRADFKSRRFINESDERGRLRNNRYEIFPDSGYYREAGVDSNLATVPSPLDDAAFLFWIRTVPLEVGKRYEYRRYFRPDRNPVIVIVEKKERVNVAGRKWNAIVIRPIIPQGRGIFAEQAEAHIWLSDDANHIILALQSKFSFGTVTLKLKEYSIPELQ